MTWLVGLMGALVGVGAGILLALLVQPVDPALSGIAGVVIGAGVAAAAAEWRARADFGRTRVAAAEDRVWAFQAAGIASTRRVLVDTLRRQSAVARGDLGEVQAIDARADPHAFASMGLLGDVKLIQEYQEELIHLRGRFGKVERATDLKRRALLEARLVAALDTQHERAVRGDPLLTVSSEDQSLVLDNETLAEALRPIGRLPSAAGVTAAAALENRGEARRGRQSVGCASASVKQQKRTDAWVRSVVVLDDPCGLLQQARRRAARTSNTRSTWSQPRVPTTRCGPEPLGAPEASGRASSS